MIVTAGNSGVRYAHSGRVRHRSPHPNDGEFKGTDHPGTRAEPFFFPGFRALK
jgi:hypothetical protein